MRLCSNQPGQKNQQVETMAEVQKRKMDELMENNDTSEDGLMPTKKVKRFRSAFTTEQIQYLDAEFKKYPYIGSARRKEVSSALDIPERAVKIWFQNRRMKEKKDTTPNDAECDEHKNSRKIDVANDQLNNECTVTSTNNRHYASLTLMLSKKEIPKEIDVAIKKENDCFPINNDLSQRNDYINQSSVEFSVDLYKQYNNYYGKPEFGLRDPLIHSEVPAHPALIQSPKNEVSSTSPYAKLPEDLSRKKKPQLKQMRTVQNPPGGYFPLNLKKYYAQPSLPVGGNMLWKPIQVLPMVSTGASAVSISNSPAGPLTVAPAPAQAKECHCECRCHPVSSPAPVLLRRGSPNPMPQYVLTALPLQNSYYTNKY